MSCPEDPHYAADVTCCCCGYATNIGEAMDTGWYPGVFDRNECVGDLCADCADVVGIREPTVREFPHNDRIRFRSKFNAIKESVDAS